MISNFSTTPEKEGSRLKTKQNCHYSPILCFVPIKRAHYKPLSEGQNAAKAAWVAVSINMHGRVHFFAALG